MQDTNYNETPLQEIIMHDRFYLTGRVKDVLLYLKNYEREYSTVRDLINSKLN